MVQKISSTVKSSESSDNVEVRDNNAKREVNAVGTTPNVKKNEGNNGDVNDNNAFHNIEYNRGKTWPLNDPADEEEEETDTSNTDESPNKETTSKLPVKTLPKKNDEKKSVVEEEKHVTDFKRNDYDQEESQLKNMLSKKEDQKLEQPSSLQSCYKTLRNVKGLECRTISTISAHPAGTSVAFLIVFFFCYCAVRRGGAGGRRWRKRMRNNRDGRGNNNAQGDYAALAVYDELLDSFDDDELSSLYQSNEGSDSSVSTILSEWSGNNPNTEMTSMEDDLNCLVKGDK